jgi:hypothetical protein
VKLAGKLKSGALFSTWQRGWGGGKKHSGNYFTYTPVKFTCIFLDGQAGGIIIHYYGFYLFFTFQPFDTSSVPMPLDMMMTRMRRRRTWGGWCGGLGYMNPANSSSTGGAEHDQPE